MRSKYPPKQKPLGALSVVAVDRVEPIHHSIRIPTSKPFAAALAGSTDAWWKLCRPSQAQSSVGPVRVRALLRDGIQGQRWATCSDFYLVELPDPDTGELRWCSPPDDAVLEMLDGAAHDQQMERRERRAVKAVKRSRNSVCPPRLAPSRAASADCPRPRAEVCSRPTRTPWITPDGWWRLTTAGLLLWAPAGARRWRETGWFISGDHLWHGQADVQPQEAVGEVLRLLLLGSRQQDDERLERRAADARRRRGLKPPHPPKRCACCGEKFTPKRTDAKCCSGKCRAKLSRRLSEITARNWVSHPRFGDGYVCGIPTGEKVCVWYEGHGPRHLSRSTLKRLWDRPDWEPPRLKWEAAIPA